MLNCVGFMKYSKIIKNLLQEFENIRPLPDLQKITHYYDEPRNFLYGLSFKPGKNYSDGKEIFLNATGSSFYSAEFALIKCLGEAAERFASTTFRKKNFLYSTYEELKAITLD